MIIGITGLSGSGKSTVANELKNFLKDSAVINVDNVVINFLLSNQKVPKEIYGESIIKDGKLNMDLLIKHPKKYEVLFKQIHNDLLDNLFSEVTRCQKKYKYIIIDYFDFSKIKEIWEQCDYKILLRAKENTDRVKNLSFRLKAAGRAKVDITLRDALAPDYSLYKYDIYLENEYDTNMTKKVETIATQLSKGT